MNSRTVLLLAIAALGAAGVLLACTTSTPTSTDGGPTDTPEAEPTWATVEPTPAASVGRTDCPENWLAFVDPQNRFSICYPPDSRVTVGEPALNIRSPERASQTQDGFTVFLSWSDTPIPASIGGASAATCPDLDYGMGTVASEYIELTLQEQTIGACLWEGAITDMEPPLPVGSLQGSIPVEEGLPGAGGFVNLQIDFGGPGVPQVPPGGEAILETLLVGAAG